MVGVITTSKIPPEILGWTKLRLLYEDHNIEYKPLFNIEVPGEEVFSVPEQKRIIQDGVREIF